MVVATTFRGGNHAVTVGADDSAFNISHRATLAITQAQFTSSATTVNVAGRDTLSFNSTFPSGSHLVVDLGPHARLSAVFNMVFGGLDVNGGRGTALINDQSDSLQGVQAVITPDVLGIGSFHIGNAQGVAGFLEFGHFVSRGQAVSVSGDPGRGLAGTVQIDKPREFHGSLVMQPKAEVDLVGLAKADSYTFENDMLKVFSGNHLIDRLRLTNDGAFIGQPHDLVVSRSGSGDVWLTQAGLTSPPPGSTTLPLHG